MEQLHAKSVWLFFIRFTTRSFFVSFILGYAKMHATLVFMSDEKQKELTTAMVLEMIKSSISLALILFVFFIIVSYIWARLSYKYYKYELKEDGFRKESGVIWKICVAIPYSRIQNVDIFRGLFDRILGLSELHIQTAGLSGYSRYGRSAEGKLPGLAPQVAEKLRDELIHKARNSKDQGL